MSARWFVISGDQLHAALQRAHDGDDPDVVLIEVYANSDIEHVEGDQ